MITNKEKNTIATIDTESNLVHKTGDETIQGTKTVTGVVQGNLKINVPQGHMLNGKIVTSVTSGTLTVAIKTLAGNDPSANDPVYVRIGNTVRALAHARSVVMNAGTNFLNLSSVELQNQEVDLFVYLWWDTVDVSVGMAVSRIPYASTMSTLNSSNTNEKGCQVNVFATITNTDECEVVGRFNAILSNTNQWSIPATSVIINRPVFETRQLTYNPQAFAQSGGFSLGNGSLEGKYLIDGRIVHTNVRFNFGSTTNIGSDKLSFTVPIQNDIGVIGLQLRTLSGGSGTAYNGTSYPITPVTNFHNGNGGVLWCVNNTANGGFVGVNNPFAWVAGCYAGAGWSYNLI